MHLLTAASLKNRALIALVTIVAAVFGLIGVGSLKQELLPSVEFPAIVVVTSYPGASPDVVNTDVSDPIETALRGVPQLENTTATSSTGSSVVLAEFTYGIDIVSTEQKVERAVNRISQLLPEQADTQVLSGSIEDFPVIQIAVTPKSGDDPEATAQLLERVVIPKLSDVDGVREAQLSGARGSRVTITPDSALLAEYGYTTQSITDTLQQSGKLTAAGTVTEDQGTLAVQAGSTLTSADDIAALPVPITAEQLATQQAQQAEQGLQNEQFPLNPAEDPANAPAATPEVKTIGDLADVSLEPNPIDGYSRVNGEPALTIAITKVSTANTVDVSHAVLDELETVESSLDGATTQVIFDQAPYVEESIDTLTTEGLLGLLFAVLVILVFLMSVRATLVTAISIPTSILLTFVGLNFAEYSLNLLTLGALTISIGRVVDDSIVVIENIKRALRPGDDRTKTIIAAVREVAGAITASTVTTIAVFVPLAFVGGQVGELFRPFAFTVSIALAASLLVSLTIVPVLAYWFLPPDKVHRVATGPQGEFPGSPGRREMRKAQEANEQVVGTQETETWLRRMYRPVITWTLARPLATLMIAVLVFGGTIAMSPLMKTNFLGADEQNSVGLTQELDPGTSIDAQLAEAERVEAALQEVSAVQTVQLNVGGSTDGFGALLGTGGDSTISYSITTDPAALQTEVQEEIRAAVESLEDAGEFSLASGGGGPAASGAIEVTVSAPDQAELAEASDAVVEALKAKDGLEQVESDLSTSRPYLRIAVDRDAAAEAGLSETAVASLVAQQTQAAAIGQITVESNMIDVYLSAGEPPANQAEIAEISIPTATGEQRLDSLATVEVADGPVTVTTENSVRVVTVSALPKGDDLGLASAQVSEALDSVKLPPGATADAGGVLSQQTEAFEQLGIALLVAILIVYVVMVATFRSLLQPLLLLISVPFAATGAILLLIVSGIPLGVASLIGVLMLIGIVVTNAIVLVDLINQFRERGQQLYDAVLNGSLQRLRPIVMTALATILALTPMGLGITGKGGFISQPLAIVVIGGLLSSTLLTLVVLPTLYYIVERLREGGKGGGPKRRGAPTVGDGPRRRAGEPSLDATSLDAPAFGASAVSLATPKGVASGPEPSSRSMPAPRRSTPATSNVASPDAVVSQDSQYPMVEAEPAFSSEVFDTAELTNPDELSHPANHSNHGDPEDENDTSRSLSESADESAGETNDETNDASGGIDAAPSLPQPAGARRADRRAAFEASQDVAPAKGDTVPMAPVRAPYVLDDELDTAFGNEMGIESGADFVSSHADVEASTSTDANADFRANAEAGVADVDGVATADRERGDGAAALHRASHANEQADIDSDVAVTADTDDFDESEPMTGELGFLLTELGIDAKQPRSSATNGPEVSVRPGETVDTADPADTADTGGTGGTGDTGETVAETETQLPAKPVATAETAGPVEPGDTKVTGDTPVEVSPEFVKPLDAHYVADPVTGELHWEQLMEAAATDATARRTLSVDDVASADNAAAEQSGTAGHRNMAAPSNTAAPNETDEHSNSAERGGTVGTADDASTPSELPVKTELLETVQMDAVTEPAEHGASEPEAGGSDRVHNAPEPVSDETDHLWIALLEPPSEDER